MSLLLKLYYLVSRKYRGNCPPSCNIFLFGRVCRGGSKMVMSPDARSNVLHIVLSSHSDKIFYSYRAKLIIIMITSISII